MSSRRTTVALLLAALVVLLMLTERPALQTTAALATCLLLPGLGWARKLRLGDRGDTFALALVISICSTVAVSTGMAVTGRWSVAAGLGMLAAITLTGFVPFGQLASRAGAVLPAPVPVNGERVAWVDWYDDARRRAAEQREAEQRSARAASERWVAWYAEHGTDDPDLDPDLDPAVDPWRADDAPAPRVVVSAAPAVDPAAEAVVPVPAAPVPAAPVAADPEDDLSGVGSAWTDWYAAARDRDDKTRRQEENEDRQAGVQWRDWYRRASLDAPRRPGDAPPPRELSGSSGGAGRSGSS